MGWRDYSLAEIAWRDKVRGKAGTICLYYNILVALALVSLSYLAGTWIIVPLVLTIIHLLLSCFTWYVYGMILWVKTADFWSTPHLTEEILLRPGQTRSRWMIAITTLPCLLLFASIQLLWAAFTSLCKLSFLITCPYRSEAISAWWVYTQLQWHRAPQTQLNEAEDLIASWYNRRDTPTREERARTSREDRLARLTAEVKDAQRALEAVEELDAKEKRHAQLTGVKQT